MKHILRFIKIQPPARLIAAGFFLVILTGACFLMLPVSLRPGVHTSFLDALFTATSATCVTGLVTVDPGDTYTVFGRVILALLIQTGGLGFTSMGAGLMLATKRRVGFKSRLLLKEALNVDNFRGIVRLLKAILLTTLIFETVGALLSFPVFVRDYPPLEAVGISIFHSISSFNNAGFDILGGGQSLIPYQNDILLNLVTGGLIIFGGLGFLVILDVLRNRSFRKLTLHSKVVISTTLTLLIAGTLVFRFTEHMPWIGAFFNSVTPRTAGFATYPINEFSHAGLFVMILLMFIGASPGSTGGGIKTSTFFILMQTMRSALNKRHMGAFHRSISPENTSRAFLITQLSLSVVLIGTFLLCLLEPSFEMRQLLFEVVSAFGTAGLSTGITANLHAASKLLLIFLMFIGRLGAFTIITMWIERPEQNARYTEESITIG